MLFFFFFLSPADSTCAEKKLYRTALDGRVRGSVRANRGVCTFLFCDTARFDSTGQWEFFPRQPVELENGFWFFPKKVFGFFFSDFWGWGLPMKDRNLYRFVGHCGQSASSRR